MAPNRRSGPNNENPDIAAIIAQQLQAILPQIVTQVTNNVNNANGGNGGGGNGNGRNNVSYTRWIEKMENVIDNSGCASRIKSPKARGRDGLANGMSWNDFKALMVEEFCPCNAMEKLESEFWNHKMVGANHAAYTDRFHELAKLVPHLVTPESYLIKSYIAGDMTGFLSLGGMLYRATQPILFRMQILRAGILTG
ncbi:reverse transcriptase domain-containing protein [Tanacetum coccineum]